MRGLVQGEASSASNPILQLFCRSGGYLADFYSGTYLVQDLHDYTVAPVTKASGNLTASEKLSTGRYVIPTGDTSAWNVGTHRATCTYKMVDGGPDYYQVHEFEILDSGDWATGKQYVGYVTTRRMYQDGFRPTTVARSTLHRTIDEISRLIERWTHRWFEPRYVQIRRPGQGSAKLLLIEAVIAIEDVHAIWDTTSGEDSYKYEQYLYKVYNRHLDGYTQEDDRFNPRIVLTDVDGDVVEVSDFAWPYGNQNIRVDGVFGYTDPEYDEHSGQVLIGHTPAPIGRIAATLTKRWTIDPSLSSLTQQQPGRVIYQKTRDQAIRFGGTDGAVMTNMSGDATIDNILAKYMSPVVLRAV